MPYIALNNQLFFFDCSTAVTCWNWEPCDTKLQAEKISRTPIRIHQEISRKRIRCVFGQGYQYLLDWSLTKLRTWVRVSLLAILCTKCDPPGCHLKSVKSHRLAQQQKGTTLHIFSEVVELWMGITLDLFIWMIWIQNPISNKSRILNQMQ